MYDSQSKLLGFILHSNFLMVAISQAQLLLDLLLGTIEHIYIGDFTWNRRPNMILVHFTPSWIKGWTNFLSSSAVVSGNVLFLVTLHQSRAEETLWLMRSSSRSTCSRNPSAKCLSTELLLLSANCLLFARWGREAFHESQLPRLRVPTNSQPKYFHPYSHQIPPLLQNLIHPSCRLLCIKEMRD